MQIFARECVVDCVECEEEIYERISRQGSMESTDGIQSVDKTKEHWPLGRRDRTFAFLCDRILYGSQRALVLAAVGLEFVHHCTPTATESASSFRYSSVVKGRLVTLARTIGPLSPSSRLARGRPGPDHGRARSSPSPHWGRADSSGFMQRYLYRLWRT